MTRLADIPERVLEAMARARLGATIAHSTDTSSGHQRFEHVVGEQAVRAALAAAEEAGYVLVPARIAIRQRNKKET